MDEIAEKPEKHKLPCEESLAAFAICSAKETLRRVTSDVTLLSCVLGFLLSVTKEGYFSLHNRAIRRHNKPVKRYWVYIVTNRSRTLYVGVTNNLVRRIHEHRSKAIEGFTKRYNIHQLVYFEETNDIGVAIAREKQLKGWLRRKKVALIETFNPHWRDLSNDILK